MKLSLFTLIAVSALQATVYEFIQTDNCAITSLEIGDKVQLVVSKVGEPALLEVKNLDVLPGDYFNLTTTEGTTTRTLTLEYKAAPKDSTLNDICIGGLNINKSTVATQCFNLERSQAATPKVHPFNACPIQKLNPGDNVIIQKSDANGSKLRINGFNYDVDFFTKALVKDADITKYGTPEMTTLDMTKLEVLSTAPSGKSTCIDAVNKYNKLVGSNCFYTTVKQKDK